MLIALCVLASCNLSNQPKLPKPPFETPIDLSRGGVVANFDILVPKHRIYHFRFRFEYPEEDQAERERVRKLVGGLNEPKALLTPVKLTILKKQAQREEVVYQKIIESPKVTYNGFGYFAKLIGACDLKRGEYRFVLESLAQRQEYASIPMKFHITFPSIFKFSFNLKDSDRSKTCPQ